MKIITLLFTRNWFPPNQSSKVAQTYAEWLKQHPPDKTIAKVLTIGVSSDENGMVLVIGISEIIKGKEKEALLNATQQNLFMAANIEGFKDKSEIILAFGEAYKVLGMSAPEL